MKNIDNTGNILHVDKVNYAPFSVVKQEDSFAITVELFRNGQELDVTGQTIELAAKRADNVVVQQVEGFTIDKNKVTISLKNNIIAVPGILQAELNIKDLAGAFTTSNFTLRVTEKILGEDSLNASDNIQALEKVKNEFVDSSNKLKDDFVSTSEKLKKDFKTTSDKQLADQKTDYESLKDIITSENPTAKLQDQINKNTTRSTSNETRIDKIENVLPVWQEQTGTGNITIQDGFHGTTRDLIIKGKTIGGYNVETGQSDSIANSCESEGNKILIKSVGKNLFDGIYLNKMINERTGEITDAVGGNVASNYISISKDFKSLTYQTFANTNYLKIAFYDSSKTFISCKYSASNLQKLIEQNIPINAKFAVIGCNYIDGKPSDLKTLKGQLEEGTIASNYVDYVEDKLEQIIPWENGLKRLITAHDKIDFEKGKAYENIRRTVLIGTENLGVSSIGNVTHKTFYYRINGGVKWRGEGLCNRFVFEQGKEVFDKPCCFLYSDGLSIGITVLKSELETEDVNGFKKLLQKWNSDGNPLIIFDELVEPRIHNIEKMALQTYDGTTHIIQENAVTGEITCKAKVSLSSQNNRLKMENKSLKTDTSFLAGTLLSILEPMMLPTEDEGGDKEKRELLNKLLEIKERA